jgi:hypothetical protein
LVQGQHRQFRSEIVNYHERLDNRITRVEDVKPST